jgi:hypothetical protein
MKHQPVASSAIQSVAYENGTLEVRFANGGTYRYDNVPAHLWEQFINARSHGTFFRQHIRSAYPGTKVEHHEHETRVQ